MTFIKYIFFILSLYLFYPLSVPAINLPIQEHTTKSGIKIWFLEDHRLPILHVRMAWKGTTNNPIQRSAAYMLTALLDEGSSDLETESFQKALARHGINMYFNTSLDALYGQMQFLSQYTNKAFSLLESALLHPHFSIESFERMKRVLHSNFAYIHTNPRYLAHKIWWEKAYPHHPYGIAVNGTTESLNALKIQDVKNIHQQMIARDNLVLAVVGDITPEKLKKIVEQTFKNIPAKNTLEIPEIIPISSVASTTHIHDDNIQTNVVFGHTGIDYNDPDFYAAYILNHILGGGISSRLGQSMREKYGLVYSVYSYLHPLDYSSIWMGGFATQSNKVQQATDILYKEMTQISQGNISEKELKEAKNYLIGSYALRFDSGEKIANQMLDLQLNQFDISYFKNRHKYITAITQKDVQHVASRLIHPDKLIIVTVGQDINRIKN